MSVARKLALLVVIALVPLTVLAGFWLSGEVRRTITAPQVALSGARTVESLIPILRKLEDLRGLVALRAAGNTEVDAQIRELSSEVIAALDRVRRAQPNPELREFVSRRVSQMTPEETIRPAPGTPPADVVLAYQELVDELLSMIEDAGAFAELTTAPNYRERLYAHLALTILPRLIDHLYIIRDIGRVAAYQDELRPDEERLLAASLQAAFTRLDRLEMKTAEAEAVQPGIDGQVLQGVEESRIAVEEYLRYARETLIDNDLRAVDADEFYARSNEAIAAVSVDNEILRVVEGLLTDRQSDGRARIAAALGISGFVLVVLCGLTVFLLRDVLRKLKVAIDFSTAIASGRRDVDIHEVAKDEFGTLHTALRDMLQSIREAETRLQESNNALHQQALVRQGQIDVAATIRREPAPGTLSEAILAQVSAAVGAAAGCLYLATNGSIEAVAGYCLPPERERVRLKLGQGIAGQAAAERRLIRTGDIPDNSLRLATCAGDAEVRDVVAIPLQFGDALVGVLEIAALSRLGDAEMDYLGATAEIIAAGLFSALTRAQIEELLEETTQQAEALRQQREELQHANTELENRASELEVQQTELAEVNRQLQAQSDVLERQKEELESVNRALEASQAEIANQVESLEVASRYKSEFLANMSHELRTPLNSILILAKLLADNEAHHLDDNEVESAATIHAAGRDLLALINDILDLAKVEAGKLSFTREELDLPGLAADLERAFAPQMRERDLEFSVSITESCPPMILSDRMRVEQVLRNFLSNAVKFTESGAVHVVFDGPPADDPDSYAVSLSVKDTGIGIPADKQEVIFEAFRQADGSTERRYGGTGLGLSICKAFAERLGGEIAVTSTPGEGSTFTLLLPSRLETREAPEAGASRRPALPEAAGGDAAGRDGAARDAGLDRPMQVSDDRERTRRGDRFVLIIEDDVDWAEMFVRGVRAAGYKAVVASTAERGLRDALELAPKAILLDHRLPGMSGSSALTRLKLDGRTRHIPVHVISVDEIGRDVRRQGAAGFVRKPTPPDEIERLVRDLVTRGSSRRRRVLLVEDDASERLAVAKLLGATGAEVVAVESAEEGLELVVGDSFDCIVLDLKLRGTSGFSFLSKLEQRGAVPSPPVIVYTGRELSDEEIERLEKSAGSIIIKGVKSAERLLDEVTLYLHSVEEELPDKHREMLARARRDGDRYRGKKVLIVDDDMRNVYSLRRALHAWGLKIEVATNGRAALARLAESRDVDLVLMDVMMPEMDGLEATRRIRGDSATAEIPIIALTAKAMKGDRETCLAAGANDYIAKPVDIDRLVELVGVWLP